jgi:hypothetical protein
VVLVLVLVLAGLVVRQAALLAGLRAVRRRAALWVAVLAVRRRAALLRALVALQPGLVAQLQELQVWDGVN